MSYGKVSAQIEFQDGTGMLINFTAMSDADMEKRLKSELEQFFSERRRKSRSKSHGKK